MSTTAVLKVEVYRVARLHPVHEPAQIRLGCSDKQMLMIAHQAEHVYADIIALHPIGQAEKGRMFKPSVTYDLDAMLILYNDCLMLFTGSF